MEPLPFHDAVVCCRFVAGEAARKAPVVDGRLVWGPAFSAGPLLAKPMSLSARLRLPAGTAEGDFVTVPGVDGGAACRLFTGDLEGRAALLFEMAFAGRSAPLRVGVPLERVDAGAWHEVVVRYTGPRLELFVDGVLVDEEWPAGAPQAAAGVLEAPADGDLAGRLERVALWHRLLSDEEIVSLAGGAEAVARREREILGSEAPVGQYWRPRGHNAFAGDCMPFHHDGRFHLFYLFDRRHHASKWHLGAHQWAHVSTTDLVHWEHHPMAVPITEEWEGSICTGSVFHHAGTFYAFYAARMADGSPARLSAAVSADGIHFEKREMFTTLGPPYQPGPARDPVVFRDGATGLFHMLVTTELQDAPVADHGGCLAHLASPDLERWEQREPFLVPGYTGQPECPDTFEWNGWYYLLFSNHAQTRYRMSRSPLGPWLRPRVDVFDGPQAAVLKTAAFTGGRRLGVAFLPQGGYGGHVVFREILQHPDGTLGTRFPAEMAPGGSVGSVGSMGSTGSTGSAPARECSPAETEAAPVSPHCPHCPHCPHSPLRAQAPEGFAAVALEGVPRNMRLALRVLPQSGASAFGLCLRASGNYASGHELRFEPWRQKVSLRPPDANSVDEHPRSSLYDVDGLDRPFTLEVIVQDDIVDVCVDGRRTLVCRVTDLDGDRLFLFAHNAEVAFEGVRCEG